MAFCNKTYFIIGLLLILCSKVVIATTYTTTAVNIWDANGAPPSPLPSGSTINLNHNITNMTGYDLKLSGGNSVVNINATWNIQQTNYASAGNNTVNINNGGHLNYSNTVNLIYTTYNVYSGGTVTIAWGGGLNLFNNTAIINVLGTGDFTVVNGSMSRSTSIINCTQFHYGGTWSGSPPSCTPALPVSLLQFNTTIHSNNIDISWTSSTETNNNYYTIERSLDGLHFETIGIVKGAGNSTNPIDYKYSDNKPQNGIIYYKLTQTDFDGKSEQFDVISVNFESQASNWKIFPNPSDGHKLYITFDGIQLNKNKTINVAVYEMSGAKIFQIDLENFKETNSTILDEEHILSKGIYLIKVTSDDEIRYEKLIVK